ncbi:MAG TPA: hypothetical protein VGZ33_00755, partial [Acidimicrobiales bacterium]|nr:hypothetical protein [Acidimicrobiales bacterium]
VGQGTSGQEIAIASANGGASWTMLNLPSAIGELLGITCLNVDTCIAVGRTGTNDTNGAAVIVETVDGTNFHVVPAPPGISALSAIECRSQASCEAVGGDPQGDGVILSYS